MKKFFALLSLIGLMGLTKLAAQTDAEMKAWQTYMTPGEVHKMIARSDGEWNEE